MRRSSACLESPDRDYTWSSKQFFRSHHLVSIFDCNCVYTWSVMEFLTYDWFAICCYTGKQQLMWCYIYPHLEIPGNLLKCELLVAGFWLWWLAYHQRTVQSLACGTTKCHWACIWCLKVRFPIMKQMGTYPSCVQKRDRYCMCQVYNFIRKTVVNDSFFE